MLKGARQMKKARLPLILRVLWEIGAGALVKLMIPYPFRGAYEHTVGNVGYSVSPSLLFVWWLVGSAPLFLITWW